MGNEGQKLIYQQKQMKVIIIEDEALAARQLKAMVQECDETIEILTILDSVETSVNWLRTHERPGHRNTFLAVCCEIVLPPRIFLPL